MMTPWLMAVFCLVTAGCTNVTDQQTSGTNHDQQVAILKQIRKVNEDGSYTFGYEAGDGSFKVESRDVLGNIKGTFGFVDAEGEIKRVSYSSTNGTGFKATTVSPLQEHVSVVQSIPRANRSSTTRKPSVVYATEASTRSSVVQSIPRTRKTTTTSTTTTSTTTERPRAIFGHYIKATPKTRPRFVINGQQRPIAVEEEVEDEDSQINRPSTEDKDPTYRRVVYAKRPVDHNLRPITEEFEEKDDDIKIPTGNTLRRQLHEETTKANSPAEANEDHADVYGGALSTTRPLFTTTTPPRVVQRLSGVRVERPKTIYVNQDNLGPARFENSKYDSPRVYESETKAAQEERHPQEILIRPGQRVQNENRDYVRQNSEPVYVRQQSEQYLRELPPNGILVQAGQSNLDDDPGFRPIPVGRVLYRALASQPPGYSTTTDSNIHYLTESNNQENAEGTRVPISPSYVRQRPFARPVPYHDQESRPRPILRPIPTPVDDRDYHQTVTPDYPYRSSTIALPPEPPNPISPPLSRRDFQMLLRRLLVSQYGTQALTYPKTYLEDALYDQQPYPSYQPAYQTPVPRQELSYDQSSGAVQYGDRVALRRPGFSRAINPLYQGNQYEDYQDPRYSKRVYRQKFYTQEVQDDGDEILPPPIREALLLRMLQLAINSDRPTLPTVMMSTTTPTSKYRKSGPVRSVQIITDDNDDDKDVFGKKM
ncbi:uncharacterized protein LOC107265054 isoform X2 [Cephus cinctus]|uniref:Uncharacterized protein LOC107265054 isoform X2 n=1 Tax=Cephus cinctus TaxID=211228 RepID=A0AAJ7BM54_CEPCN|nr:uncharacterized protein LOC107265054 isoform X2 [Cephus cinctus]